MALRAPKVTQTTVAQDEQAADKALTGVLETKEEQGATDAARTVVSEQASADSAGDVVADEQEVRAAVDTRQDAEVETVSGGTEHQDDAGTAVVTAEEVQSREVAVAGEGDLQVVKTSTGGVFNAFTQNMADLGFEGLNVSGMSFDRVKLTEGNFVLGTDEFKLGESFDCVLMGTRPIFIVRQYDGDEAKVYFSYDAKGDVLTDGTSSEAIREEWLEDGYGTEDAPLDIKRYLEGMAQLVNRTDEYEGQMVSLSIPPASTDRLGGATMIGFRKFKVNPDKLVLTCKVGAKITKGSISWRPWVFVAKSVWAGE